MTQSARILAYLQTGKSLTPMQALRLFGCMALSQRIGDLKREGHRITSTMVRTRTGKHVASYRLNAWAHV